MPSFKSIARDIAYENGTRHCPCCGIQLTWKAQPRTVQKNLATVDHIIPKSMGGSNSVKNMFVMCRDCNEKRGDSCFVEFVTAHGISKSYVETLYKEAHKETLKVMLAAQFTQNDPPHVIKKINRKRRGNIRKIIRNYTEYFGDYLPEFELLEKIL